MEGWNEEKGQVIRTVKILVESLKEEASDTTEEKEENTDQNGQKPGNSPEGEQTPSEENGNSDKEQTGTDKETDIDKETDTAPEASSEETDSVKEDQETQDQEESEPVSEEEEFVQAEPGKTGEVAQEIPQAVPVGSLIDANTGVRVEGDFLPYYVDLQVSYNEDLDQLPDAGIGQILSAYEIKLWDLKEDEEYTIPEGKKVRVMIPLPENAGSFPVFLLPTIWETVNMSTIRFLQKNIRELWLL